MRLYEKHCRICDEDLTRFPSNKFGTYCPHCGNFVPVEYGLSATGTAIVFGVLLVAFITTMFHIKGGA